MTIKSSKLYGGTGRVIPYQSTDDANMTTRPYATKCMDFASGRRVDCSTRFNFERTDSFSVGIWYKGTQADERDIVGDWYDVSSLIRGWRVYLAAGGKLALMLNNSYSGGNRLVVRGGTAVNTGSWVFLAMTYAGTSLASGVKFYVNGSLETNTVTYDTLSATTVSTAQTQVGANVAYVTTALTGRLCSLTIVPRVLTQNEITELYNAGKPIHPKQISLYPSQTFYHWPLGDGDVNSYDVTSLARETINGQHGVRVSLTDTYIVSDAP